MSINIGPIEITATGVPNGYAFGCRIGGIIWDGASTSGDRVVLNHMVGGEKLWQARTDTTETHLGLSLPTTIHVPYGFFCSVLDSGILLVYLREAP